MSLASEPRHGYAILKDIEAITEGRVKMSTGTLFGALNRMLTGGWIRRAKSDDTSRDKQHYEVTAKGTEVLEMEVARMRLLARRATARMSPRRA